MSRGVGKDSLPPDMILTVKTNWLRRKIWHADCVFAKILYLLRLHNLIVMLMMACLFAATTKRYQVVEQVEVCLTIRWRTAYHYRNYCDKTVICDWCGFGSLLIGICRRRYVFIYLSLQFLVQLSLDLDEINGQKSIDLNEIGNDVLETSTFLLFVQAILLHVIFSFDKTYMVPIPVPNGTCCVTLWVFRF